MADEPTIQTQEEKMDAAAFIRRALVRNPRIELEELHRQWAEYPHARGRKKPTMQQLHSTRYQVKQKYGLKDIADLPMKTSGEPSISGLLRLLLKKHPDITDKQAAYYLRQDGLTYSAALFTNVRRELQQEKVRQPAPDHAHPDANFDKGPRARFVSKRGRKPGRRATKRDKYGMTKDDRALAERYMAMENSMDDFVQAARDLEDSELVEIMRRARRYVILKVMNMVPPPVMM